MNRMIKRIPALLSAAILLLSSCGTAGSQTADSGSAQAQSAASSVSTVAASPRTPAVLDLTGATADTDGTLGWVSISNSLLDLTAGEDGVQAETALTISEGSCTAVSGGGSGVQPSDGISAKGLKAGTTLTLNGGTFTLDCSDDAVHSNGDVTVSGGVYTISTGDDAFHADEALTVSAREINILTSYEGLEGTSVSVSGGTIYIVSSDDGVNAAGGADGSGFGGFGRGTPFGGNSGSLIHISGGYLVVRAGGDGLDSNGNAIMSGGTVIVSSTGQGDGALDYDGSFTLSGGILLAADSGAMSQSPSEASQYTLSLGFDSVLPAGTFISLEREEQSLVFALPSNASHVVISSPELEGGAVYTLSYGGEYSGQTADGLCSGGTCSGGTEAAELTLSDYITTYGRADMGGRPGGPRGGTPREDWGEPPTEGMPPDQRPGGGERVPGTGWEGQQGHSGPDGMPDGRGAGRGEPPEEGAL